MSTSGSYLFTVNQNDIVVEAMLNTGALGESETPTAQEYKDCVRKLQMMVKQWMGRQDFAPGLKMWTRTRGDLFLGYTQFQYRLGPTGDNWAAGVTGGTFNQTYNSTTLIAVAAQGATNIQVSSISAINNGDYIGILVGTDLFWTTVNGAPSGTSVPLAAGIPAATGNSAQVFNYTTKGQRPLSIETALLRDVYQNDTPLNRMTLEDYELLPTKTSVTYQADPSAFYYESQIGASTATSNGQFYIQCGGAQDVTKEIHIVALNPVQDINNPGDNPAYPQQWYRALCWGLSREICGMFDTVWTDEMKSNLMEAMLFAREADAEVSSFYFQREAGSPFEP